MKAILATRCGCQQAYEVSYPPPPEIWLPLHPKREWGVESFDPDGEFRTVPRTPHNPVQTRRFVLSSEERVATPGDTAYYAED